MLRRRRLLTKLQFPIQLVMENTFDPRMTGQLNLVECL